MRKFKFFISRIKTQDFCAFARLFSKDKGRFLGDLHFASLGENAFFVGQKGHGNDAKRGKKCEFKEA